MLTPSPPTPQQAEVVQKSRHAAETAVLQLFSSFGHGAGSGEGEPSVLQTVKISTILSGMAAVVIRVSFGHPEDRTKSALFTELDSRRVADEVLPGAQETFGRLATSELPDKQKAVVWATWAHSSVSDKIAGLVNGEVPHIFSDRRFKLKKVWISRADANVRELHTKLHGKTVPVDADFWRWPHTGQRLRWPGDDEAPLEATIGCRCVGLLTWASQDLVSTTIRRIVEHTNP